jgi:hypothetical protein
VLRTYKKEVLLDRDQFLEEINTGTWLSMLGESQKLKQ